MTTTAVRTFLAARSKLGYAGNGLDHMNQQWAHVLVQRNPEKISSGLHGLHGLFFIHLIQNAWGSTAAAGTPRACAAVRSLELSKTAWSKWAKRSMWSKRGQLRPRRPPGEQR